MHLNRSSETIDVNASPDTSACLDLRCLTGAVDVQYALSRFSTSHNCAASRKHMRTRSQHRRTRTMRDARNQLLHQSILRFCAQDHPESTIPWRLHLSAVQISPTLPPSSQYSTPIARQRSHRTVFDISQHTMHPTYNPDHPGVFKDPAGRIIPLRRIHHPHLYQDPPNFHPVQNSSQPAKLST